MSPRWGLVLYESRMLHKCRPSGAKAHIFTTHFIDDRKIFAPENALPVGKTRPFF